MEGLKVFRQNTHRALAQEPRTTDAACFIVFSEIPSNLKLWEIAALKAPIVPRRSRPLLTYGAKTSSLSAITPPIC